MEFNKIREWFATAGAEPYAGEAVTQLEHACQSAAQAEASGAAKPLIVAALLHDVGHMANPRDAASAEMGVDARHEVLAARLLDGLFGPEVIEPIRLHVQAKAWLCANERGYADRLSPVSQRSLALQGGPLSAEDSAAFLALPFAQDAIALRRWDDLAKDPDARTPSIDHFLHLAEQLATREIAG